MNDAWAIAVVISGGIATIGAAVEVLRRALKAAKRSVVHYVENEIALPLREAHHQLTVNHHSSAEPTVLDKLDEVKTEQRAQRREFESLHSNVADLTGMLMEHLQNQGDR